MTRDPASQTEVYALFDWSQFDDDEKYLDEVLILAEEREPVEVTAERPRPFVVDSSDDDLPRDGSHGTVLRMNRLKRTWGGKEIDDLRRGLSRLISPFDTERGFRIFLQLPDESAGDAQEVEPPTIVKYPHYSIGGNVQADGRFTLSIEVHSTGASETRSGWFGRSNTKRGELASFETEHRPENFDPITCGAFDFRILVWDRDQLDNIEQKLGIGLRSIRNDLNSIAGISIYRDGFRVLPYGEPENDWLRLDLRRVQNPTLRLSNNQITGYIRIGADSNPLLHDQSNREGLDNNQAYSDLQATMLLALSTLEGLRFKEKKKEKGPSAPQVNSLFDTPDVSALREKLVALRPDTATLNLFDQTTKQWEGQVVRLREVLSRYHSLATLGQLIDKVVHDSRQPLATIQGQSALARELIESWLEKQLSNECRETLTSIDQRLAKVRESAGLIDLVLRRVEPLGGRRRGRPTKLYMEEIVRNAFSHYDQEIRALSVKTTLPSDLNLVTVDGAELQEIFINLLSNSLYWLSQVPKDRRAITVQCARPKPGELEIIFADSGPGVLPQNRNAIFEPYFSTKPDGVGLGLVITGEIIRDYYDGTLELLDSGPLDGAVFRILLRKRV